jgi:tetratricopeptide (TPR) repeat protein
MAWRKTWCRARQHGGGRSAREVAAIERAYEIRDRLPERERLQTVAYYHFNVDQDLGGAIQAYEAILEHWPEDVNALNNLSIAYIQRRRYADAERTLRKGIEESPRTGVLWCQPH